MTLSEFIERHLESILEEWESFARSAQPDRGNLDREGLRNWANALLRAMAAEMSCPQTGEEQTSKSRGERPAYAPALTEAAEEHAMERLAQGFDLDQMVSEYRALRATVVRLWTREGKTDDARLQELVRFNEAMDQALTESIRRYSARLDRARDLFVGALGHDMRTPLGSILVTTEALLLSSEELDSRHLQSAVRIRNAGNRLNSIVNDLLDFTQTRLGGRLSMWREETELAQVCSAIVEEVRAIHPGRDIQLECPSTLDGHFDASRVGQMLSNLILNAVRYGYQDSPVKVTAHKTADDVLIRVHNEGEPIPDDLRRRMFDPLVRGRDAESPAGRDRHGGVGLGLYIASEIARGHDGKISVKSTVGSGTTFEARLSRHRSDNDDQADIPAGASSAPAGDDD